MIRITASRLFVIVQIVICTYSVAFAGNIEDSGSTTNRYFETLMSQNKVGNIGSNLELVLLNQSSGSDKTPYIFSLMQSQWENSRDIADRFGFMKIDTNPTITDGLLFIDGEIAYSPADNLDFEQGYRQYSPRMYNLNIGGNILGIDYGIIYRTFDSEYGKLLIKRDKNDKIGREFWIRKSFSIVTIKSFVSDYLNNIYIDPGIPKTRNQRLGTSFEFNIPHLPQLKISYSRGQTEKVQSPEKTDIPGDSYQNYDAYIYYWKEKWDVSMSSGLSLSNSGQADLKSKISTLEVSGTYRPDWTLIFTPTLGIVNEDYNWAGGGVNYFMKYASLSISYFPSPSPLGIYLYGYYYNYLSSDSYTNSNSFSGYTELAWNLGRNFLGDQKLSLEFGFYNYIDSVFSINNYNDFNTLIAYKITGI